MDDKSQRSEPAGGPGSSPDAQTVLEGRLGGRSWHVVADVEDFRALASQIVRPTDRVVELGASTGDATVVLAEFAELVVAVEKSAERVEQLQELAVTRDNIQVVHADAAMIEGTASRLPRPTDVLFVDLGGDAPASRAGPICFEYARLLEPRSVVFRNHEFHEFLRTLQVRSLVESDLGRVPELDAQSRTTDPAFRAHSARRLCRVLESAVTRGTAEVLTESLRDANYRTRKLLAKALRLLGELAHEPLINLLADETAPIRARRVSASVLRQSMATPGGARLADLSKHSSVGVQWIATVCLLEVHRQLGSTYRPTAPLRIGEQLALAETRGEPLSVELTLSLLRSQDGFSNWLARRHLRRTVPTSARLLQQYIVNGEASTADLVAAMGVLGVLDAKAARLLPERLLADAPADRRPAALWRLATQCFGLADQRLATDLLNGVAGVWTDAGLPGLVAGADSDTPVGALLRLWRAKGSAWHHGRLLELRDSLATVGLDLCPAMEAGMESPHAHFREQCRRALVRLKRPPRSGK